MATSKSDPDVTEMPAAEAEPAPEAAAGVFGLPDIEAVPSPACWRYSGPERIYTAIPVTVRDGDIVEWVGLPPDDGCWTRINESATRRPDNHIEPEVSPDA